MWVPHNMFYHYKDRVDTNAHPLNDAKTTTLVDLDNLDNIRCPKTRKRGVIIKYMCTPHSFNIESWNATCMR